MLTVIVLAVVIGLGVLIFKLQRRAQAAVPRVADGDQARGDRVVAVDADGRAVTEAEDAPAGPRPRPGRRSSMSSPRSSTRCTGPDTGDAAEGDAPGR